MTDGYAPAGLLAGSEARKRRVAALLAPWANGFVPPSAPPAVLQDAPAAFSEGSRSADAFFMDAALTLARAAAEEGEVPVGCVIVRENRIVTGEYNGREGEKNALWHAEIAAIDAACRILRGWRLPGCTLYVTLEPCLMCAGAIWNARIPRVVIGAKDARAGAMGSLLNLAAYPLNPKPEVLFGVRERECRELLQSFFARKR